MIVLSDRFKDAFKVALAMAITYGIALSMDWEKPFWAGLSVAFCSLATTGESLNRGVHRAVGTFLAGVATLTLVALFPQDRWPFLLAMSGFIALCTYRLSGGSRFAFIWFNAGFNVPIVAMLGGNVGLNSFDVIVLRVQETALGVVVYSLVALLVWPRRGGADFEKTVRSVCDAQRRLFGLYLKAISGVRDDSSAERLRAELTGHMTGLGERLEGAVYDSDEIWEVRHAWRRCLDELSALNTAMEHWRLGFDELEGLDLQRLMPGLPAFDAELETRFAAMEDMLARQSPPQEPGVVDLRLDREQLRALSHFQRAAVLLCRDQLGRIETLTRGLCETISDIRGYGHTKGLTASGTRTPSSAVIDLDRLAATVRQSATLWLTLLMVMFVPAFPNPVGVVALANAFAMVLTMAPHVPAGVLLLPTILASLFAGSLYLFVMPHLSGFGQLSVMIFVATFLIGYVFHQPRAVLAKSMGLCMLVIVIGVENQQSYNFLYFANWFIAGILFVLALMVAWRFPISFRPEDRFEAMLGRFLRSAEFLLSTPDANQHRRGSWLSRWRRAFHLHEVTVLPHRLQAWGRALPPAALGDTHRDLVQSLVTSLQALGERLQLLLETRAAAGSGFLVRELLEDMRDWHAGVQQAFRRLSADPGAVDRTAFRARVDARLAGLEARMEAALDKADEGRVSDEERGSMYRLLGAYRGLSEALVDVSERVTPMDWARLREARF